MSPPSDEVLLARQSALQEEAREVLAGLDLAAVVAGAGPLLVTGSFVSRLMCWPEVDVMVHVGSGFSPPDVMSLLAWIVSRPGVTGLDYRDERGPRCVTGQVRDERYHVPLTVEHAGRSWQIDLTAVAARSPPERDPLARRAACAHHRRGAHRGAAH